MSKAKKLFTIGYEQTPARAVLDELERAGVKLLVDVRAVRDFPRHSLPPDWTNAASVMSIFAASARQRTDAKQRAAAT